MAYVCNLFFFEAGCVATAASGPAVADGQIFVSTIEGDGLTVKYNLNADFNYNTSGQTSATFTGLVPGTYTIYARSNNTCLKTLQMTVTYVVTYSPKYRMDFYDFIAGQNIKCRVDIEKRSYAGSVSYVIAGDNPARPEWRGESEENPFKAVIGSEMNVTLVSMTDEQFIEFAEADEREYRASYYIWESGAYVLKWRGYQISQNHAEPYYMLTKYDVHIQFTDGLADLRDIPFSDDSGNAPVTRMSFLSGILLCLHKTDIELQVWETVNILAAGMDDADADSGLGQAFFDPGVYMQDDGTMEDSLTVLDSLLTNFGSRVHQSKGHWQIDLIQSKAATSILTRKLSFSGGSISTSNEAYQVLIRRASATVPKVSFMDQSGQMKVIPQYGTINFTTDLGLEDENNLLPRSDFRAVDLVSGQFDGWQTSTPNPTPEVVTAPGRTNVLKAAFDAEEPNWSINVQSQIIPLATTEEPYQIRITFDLFASPAIQGYSLFFDLSASIVDGTPDDYYLGQVSPSGGGENLLIPAASAATDLVDGEYLRYYVDEVGAWKTYTLYTVVDPTLITDLNGDFQLKFRFDGNYFKADIATLKTEATTGFTTAFFEYRRYAVIGTAILGYYKLRPGTDAESSPNIIRPNDYNGATNPYVWELTGQVSYDPSMVGLTGYFMLHNVQVQYLPNSGETPVNSFTSTVAMNSNMKRTLDVQLRHFDLSDVDENYKHITKGWISLEDGTPTADWNLRASGGGAGGGAPKTLLDLITAMYQGQYTVRRRKLFGDMDAKDVFPDLGNTFYEVRSGRTFIPMSLTQNPRQRSITDVELIEILDGGEIIDETDPNNGQIPGGDIDPPEPPDGDDPNPFRVHSVDHSVDHS